MNQSIGYDYPQLQNPTTEALENIVAKLENGFDTITDKLLRLSIGIKSSDDIIQDVRRF